LKDWARSTIKKIYEEEEVRAMKKSLVVLVAMFTMVVFASVSMAQAPAKPSDKPAAAAPEKTAAPTADKAKAETPKTEKKNEEKKIEQKKPEEKKSAPAEKKG
jgi:hypothetical protein